MTTKYVGILNVWANDFEFFVYGCKTHIEEFVEAIKKDRKYQLQVLDHGSLKKEDRNYGKDCAFESSGEGFADYFALVAWKVVRYDTPVTLGEEMTA